MTELGDAIKTAREEAGLTQEALGQMIGATGKTVGNIERGGGTSEARVRKLEEALQVGLPREEAPASTFTARDDPPSPRNNGGGKSRGVAAAASGPMSLAKQLELPYKLGGDALRQRLPVTSSVLYQQATPCAQAWDQFLYRFPALREKLESGMVAQDVVVLIMAHVPILMAARAELEAQQQAQAPHYEGGIGVPGPA